MDIQLSRSTRIKLFKEYLKFSAAHFTIFSATDRERIHGHNFTVQIDLDLSVNEDGISTSYRSFKDSAKILCESLDEHILLPQYSQYLSFEMMNNQYLVKFNGEELFFPIADTKLLPVRNTTVEELSFYILNQITKEFEVEKNNITFIEITVSSGAGQSGSTKWTKPDGII